MSEQQLTNLAAFLAEGDAESERMLEAAAARFGHPMNWPMPPHTLPRWYQFSKKRQLRKLEAWFGPVCQDDIDAFWNESHKGQSIHEDAGSYVERCYRALLALPVEEPVTYQKFLDAAIPGAKDHVDER